VQDDIAILREHGPSATGHNTAEVSDIAVRIELPIKDVDPLELTAVILSVKAHLVTNGDRARNHGAHNILVEDVANFVGSRLVSRVNVVSRTLGRGLPAEGEHADELVIGRIKHVEAWRIRVDGVVETTVRTLDAERREQFIRFGIPVILANVGIQPDQVFAGFGTADEHEHRGSVFTAHGLRARAVANQLHVQPFQDTLCQLALRQSVSGKRAGGGGSSSGRNRTVNTNQVSHADAETIRPSRVDGENTNRGSAGDNEVTFSRNLLGVQLPITVLPNQGGRLREDIHDVGELFFAFNGKAQIFQGDIRGINRGPLQAVLTELLSESNASEGDGECVSSR